MGTLQTDLVIVGAGPVGLFCAFQCGHLGLNVHIVDALPEIGGQPAALYPEKYIYDIPAAPKILAADLIENLKKQIEPYNPTIHLNNQIKNCEKTSEGFFLTTDKNLTIKCKAVIIAVGGGAFGPNRPPLANIEHYEKSQSVHYFIKNRSIFDNKNIVIAGGGDSAVDWAIMLADSAKKIYMVHRRDNFRAAPSSIEKLKALASSGRIDMVIPFQLSGINGNGTNIQSIEVENLSGEKRNLEAEHLLAFFGLSRDLSDLKNWGLNMDKATGCISVEPTTCETNIEGIFAIGDCAHYPRKLKLILSGFAEAALAVNKSWDYIHPDRALNFVHSTSRGEHS